jgi:hypothetical protein
MKIHNGFLEKHYLGSFQILPEKPAGTTGLLLKAAAVSIEERARNCRGAAVSKSLSFI